MEPSSAHWIACQGITTAVVRDELGKAYNKLAILEEFDQVLDSRAAHGLVQARCDVNTASVVVNRQFKDHGRYIPTTLEIFGATILHVRDPLGDPALMSRSIALYTRHGSEEYSDPVILPGWYDQALAEIDWTAPITGFRGGRIFDTWKPSLQVAAGLGDEEWLEWARGQVDSLQTQLEEAAGYDLRHQVLARVIQILEERESSHVDMWQDRIEVDFEIGSHIRASTMPWVSARDVAAAVKSMNLSTSKKAGKLCLWLNEAALFLACDAIGYQDDEWIEELRTRDNRRT